MLTKKNMSLRYKMLERLKALINIIEKSSKIFLDVVNNTEDIYFSK